MFDTSYARSRVYFKTLEILRIFGDIIRETGRDLQEMDPERLLQGSFLRAGWDVRYFLREEPATDKALWKNWRILSEFQKGAEERLIRRINEKTEEIKSLRDGVSGGTRPIQLKANLGISFSTQLLYARQPDRQP